MADSWLEYRHETFDSLASKWRYARDHYKGELLDDGKIGTYLIRRSQGESQEAYEERKKLADYTPHFAAVVDSLAGLLFGVEDNATRVFGDEDGNGLGVPEDPTTFIGRLWRNADGQGNGYLTVFKQAASMLIHSHRLWCVVTGGSDGIARIRLFPPTAVPNWIESGGRIIEARLEEQMDTRETLRDPPTPKQTHVHFTPEGWERFESVEDDEGEVHERTIGEGEYFFEDPDGVRVPAIFMIELPLRRQVGYILARKANAIFNQESQRDHLLTVASFPKLNIVAADELFDAIVSRLKAGSNVLQVNPGDELHSYIAPDSAPAKAITEVLKRKVDEFWRTAFREYGDSARERTATEVRQDVASGVGAFLQLLKAAVDDMENQVLWRLAQIEFPDDSSKHFVARVERSSDFLPPDIDVVIDRLRKRYFGETTPVPVGRQGLAAVARQIAEYDGIKIPDDQIEAAVDSHLVTSGLDILRELPVPAAARAFLVLRTLQGFGLFDEDGELQGEDGEVISRLEEIRDAALSLAEAKEEGEVRNSRAFGV